MQNRKQEVQEKLATGQITIAEAVGLGKDQLYAIAEQGYRLLGSGRLDEARQIYAGLVAADPYDSVFRCHLGAVLWRQGETEQARGEFDAAIRLNFANVDALAARGELRILAGDVRGGLEDLRTALEHDAEATRPSTQRARALILSLRQATAAGN